MIRVVENSEEKPVIARHILEGLTDWFGVPESRERYIAESAHQPMVAAWVEGEEEPVGFLCLKETGKATMEIAVMGVLQRSHRRGLGTRLFQEARRMARELGYAFLQVKTVRMGCYEDYDRTNLFYLSLGFQEFEVIPELWGPENPCQIYVMAL